MFTPKPLLSAHETRLVSVLAVVDPRTLTAYLRGRACSTTSIRIERALVTLGLSHLITYQGTHDPDSRRSDIVA